MNRFKRKTSDSLIRFTIIFIIFLFILKIGYANEVPEEIVEDSAVKEESWWLWVFLGRLHPLMVHFPVALLIIAGLLELLKIKTFHTNLRAGINWMVYIGTAGSILAVVLGLLLSNTGEYGGETFEWHQWTGIITSILAILTASVLWYTTKKDKRTFIPLYRGLLFFTVASVSLAGHFGGSLTHGQDYLLSTTPWAPKDEALADMGEGVSVADIDFASFSSNTDSLSSEQVVKLNLAARTILAHKCYQCHSSDKTEGKLRLDSKEHVFKGGESGQIIKPGDAEHSEIVRRITLPAGHKESMPGKGKRLSNDEVNIIKLWIDKGAPWPDNVKGIFRVAPLAPRKPELPNAVNGLTNPIDRIVNSYFDKKDIKWPKLIDDRTFLRRIYFDLIGLPPTLQELKEFEADTKEDKRERIIEVLLAKDYEYATHWTTFWNDLLRNDYTGTGYITQGRFNISAWLYNSLLKNKSYQQFAMELIDPMEESKGFIKGIAWRGAVNSSQTTAMQAAQNVSQALLGINLKCASCHDSFVSDWKLDDAYAFANIFSETPLEINRCDVPTGKMADTRILWPELGTISKEGTVQEKSKQLAAQLTQPENGRLYRTLVNRIWAQLMGRGIVAPVDEMDKEPWSQDLLDWLAVNFVEEGYDIKKLLYLITSSKTYQMPSMNADDPIKINAENYVFIGMLKRKLTAEQFADAVSSVVYPVYPWEAIKYNPYANLDTYKSSSKFVRAALVQNDPFQIALGRPSRENITSSRDGQATLLQAMELTNGSKLNETLKLGAKQWIANYNNSDKLIQAIYNQGLGRIPTSEEEKVAKDLLGNQVNEEAVQDLLWAMVLHPEFQFIE